MSRIDAVSVTLLFVSLLTMPARSQEPKSSGRQYVTVEGTVERTDSFSRALTLRTSANTTQTINVPRELELFGELRTGDRITVRLSESVIVAVRPGGKPSVAVDTTASAKPAAASAGSEVLQQLKAAVTVESVDRPGRVIVYKTADSRKVIRAVADPQLLEGLKAGDVIEITYTRERAIDLQRAR
jgi:hypothetical protein